MTGHNFVTDSGLCKCIKSFSRSVTCSVQQECYALSVMQALIFRDVEFSFNGQRKRSLLHPFFTGVFFFYPSDVHHFYCWNSTTTLVAEAQLLCIAIDSARLFSLQPIFSVFLFYRASLRIKDCNNNIVIVIYNMKSIICRTCNFSAYNFVVYYKYV